MVFLSGGLSGRGEGGDVLFFFSLYSLHTFLHFGSFRRGGTTVVRFRYICIFHNKIHFAYRYH